MGLLPPSLRTTVKGGLSLLRGRAPGQLVIQYTDACNACCPQCGMRTAERYLRSKLEPTVARRIIERAAANGVMSLSITGGEPFIYVDEVLGLLRFARARGIKYTRTGTNGFLFQGVDKPSFDLRMRRLAEKLIDADPYTFWISLDSADASAHEEARGLPGVVEGIRRALPILHSHDIYPAANLGINRMMGKRWISRLEDPETFTREATRAIRDFYEAAIDLGFTTVNACYPMNSDDLGLQAQYRATSANEIVSFSPEEKARLFAAMAAVIPEFRARIRIFSPVASLKALSRQHTRDPGPVAPCRGGADFFYVSAHDGLVYPCGYRGQEPLGKATSLDLRRVRKPPTCSRCDWECFRDPSEMMAPVTTLIRHPAKFAGWCRREPAMAAAWWTDWRYYRACGYFDSSRAPEPDDLAAFGT